ncbi:MAG: hypothetical protein VX294_15105 [Candidatus Latescibacterota bacterium]|nr:hypothetical protein [Candidatus Latescibacterota bacterium]
MSANIDEKIQRIVGDSIAELNAQRLEDCQLPFHANAALFGKDGTLDSLGLVQLIVALEQRCELDFGVRPNLSNLLEHVGENMPFSSVHSLCLHLTAIYK